MVNEMGDVYELGSVSTLKHNAEKLTSAFGLEDEEFNRLIRLAKEAWNSYDSVSESIEEILRELKGSGLVLALVFFGRIWEQTTKEEEWEV